MEEAEESDLMGRTVGGTYRIEERLGAGGMGEVFRATHSRTGRPYAVKVLLPEMAVRRDAMKRFRREAEAVGALGHSNVVAIHDFDVQDGLAFLVMDLLEGEDLAERLERERLSLSQAIQILEGVCAGLGAAHAAGLVHRDLKPANVFLSVQPGAPERAVLLDFGLAKSLAREGDVSQLTASGVVMGTPHYMSPEQASGLPMDARADLYAVATIFYEMLAGQTPFTAPTLPALFAQLAMSPAPPLEIHRTDLPPALSSVLDRALAKSPDERYPNASQLIAAIRSAASGAVGSAPDSFPPTEAAVRPKATPVGNAAASWPRGIDPMAPTQATPDGLVVPRHSAPAVAPTASANAGPKLGLFVVAALLLFGGIGLVGGLSLYWMQIQDTHDQLAEIQRGLPPPTDVAETQRAIAEAVAAEREAAPVIAAAPPSPIHVEPVPVSPEATEPEARARRRRRRVLARDTESSPARPMPAPAGQPAGPPGMPQDGTAEAIEYMGRQDYDGCLRETHRHPRSIRLLATRMSCARSAGNNAELRSTCAEIRQHYPQSGYNNACSSLMNNPSSP